MKLLCKFPAYNDRLRSWFKLKERSARDWKFRSTKVDYGSECVNLISWKLFHVYRAMKYHDQEVSCRTQEL